MTSEPSLCNSGLQDDDSAYIRRINLTPLCTTPSQPVSYPGSSTSSGSMVSPTTSTKLSVEISSITTTIQDLETESSLSASSIPSSTTPSPHSLLILGSVLGVAAFIILVLLLLFAFLFFRRRKRERKNTDRESQILEPYVQEKTAPSEDQGEVLSDRARIGELEEALQRLILNDCHQHSITASEVDGQLPPDYRSASSSPQVVDIA
ncbi:hypothetical protein EDD18DRAFT_1366903 [Armillaria luteobubalina]|uniref:Uncharacterized protein n=1 Tax=Armillaria luteobubalina TaxID=153913 RepID=A0AA39P165_9AGAR|nr:hypothetical protein EDD18DRAFT_1366903 [Armillaria luteobubalina]